MKVDINEIRNQYPLDSISQAFSKYLEDVIQLSGAVGCEDAAALYVCITATNRDVDDREKVAVIEEVFRHEYVGQIDEAWNILDRAINQEEEKEEEIFIEGI